MKILPVSNICFFFRRIAKEQMIIGCCQEPLTIPFCKTLEEFQVNEEAIMPLRQLKAAGFLLVVTTNQPELSRGHLNRRELDRMHSALKATFPLDDILVCPHDEMDECPCRKTRRGLFTEAAFKWQIDLERSFVIGGHWRDAQAAANVGCLSVMLESPWLGTGHHDMVLPDLAAAAQWIGEVLSPVPQPLATCG